MATARILAASQPKYRAAFIRINAIAKASNNRHDLDVDDLLISGPVLDEIALIKAALSKRFDKSDLSECHFYLTPETLKAINADSLLLTKPPHRTVPFSVLER
ncbi:hypothetical protein E4U52_000169 [Claviceps spartinae]|nr:hypothetical protein E4U52_000169 [Claviceps spartinae]